jgi:hypothetical protein
MIGLRQWSRQARDVRERADPAPEIVDESSPEHALLDLPARVPARSAPHSRLAA